MTRKIYRNALGIVLKHATKVPGMELCKALKATFATSVSLEKAANCWEVDKDLAYEQFGSLFAFSAPQESSRRSPHPKTA